MAGPSILAESNADEISQQVFEYLATDAPFTLPVVDLSGSAFQLPTQAGNPAYDAVATLTNDDLTTKVIDGTGTFDVLMTSQKAHLQGEYDAGRITGDQYTKAYIELTSVAMGSAVSYLLGRDAAYYQAMLVQAQVQRAEIESVTAAVNLETAKAELASMSYTYLTNKAAYTLAKMKLATEDIQFALTKNQSEVAAYQLANILPAQKALTEEQIEVQRAQTMDTRVDGVTTIVGSVGRQKALYDQQITSYQRDSEYKTAKMYLDAWITQKTLDEGLAAPTELTNTVIEDVLNTNRVNNGLVPPPP